MGYDNRISVLRGDTFVNIVPPIQSSKKHLTTEQQLHRAEKNRQMKLAMTERWEIQTKDGYKTITNPREIVDTIKEGLKKGDVSVNGKRVRIVQRNGEEAWEYLPGF